MATYKELHEAFMSGLKGSSVQEVLLVSLIVPLVVLARRCGRTSEAEAGIPAFLSPSWLLNLFLDLALISIPLLLAVTLTQYRTELYVCLLLVAALLRFASSKSSRSETPQGKDDEKKASSLKLEFLNDYRAMLLLLTCVAILAVDFRVFPRFLAKTESFGYSLMDIGVGSFVFSNAMVSRKARLGASKAQPRSVLELVKGTAVSVSPMLILGAIRLVGTKSADYQEHVSEYGVHWNFFFTLAIVALLVAVVNVPSGMYAPVGIACAVAYQVALSSYGLEDYILNAPRTSIISMNKEGLCSSIGFFAICCFGTWLGHCLFRIEGKVKEAARTAGGASDSSDKYQGLTFLVSIDVALWVLTYLSVAYVGLPSRRMANLSYILFTVSYNVFLIACLRAIDLGTAGMRFVPAARLALTTCLVTRRSDSLLIHGLNRNGLVMFLIANLSTGAVNLSMHTIFASDGLSLSVLSGYLAWLAFVAAALHSLNITLKFW